MAILRIRGLEGRGGEAALNASKLRTISAVVAAALCASCAGMYAMKLPSQGGPAWAEYETQNFRLVTNLPERDAQKTAAQLEARRSGLLRAAWGGADFKSRRTRVVLFRNGNELQEFLFRYIGGYWLLDDSGEKLMVLAHDSRDGVRVLTHELAHDVASSYFARQPRWLGEGLAGFLETLELDEAAGVAVVGRPGKLRVRYSNVSHVFENERLGGPVDYGQSWALVFYLANHEGRAFNEYQKALSRGDEPDAAWKASFPAYSTKDGLWDLDKKVSSAMRELEYSRRFNTARARFTAYSGPILRRGLGEPEIRALRAELFLTSPHGDYEHEDRRKIARAEIDEALRAQPDLVPALAQKVQLAETVAERVGVANEAARQRPDDPHALLLLDQALDDDAGSAAEEAERTSRLERAVRFAPDNPWALQRLARAYAKAGRADAAIVLARQSLRLFPDSTYALDSFALAAIKRGDCRPAKQLQQMAVNRLPHVPEGFEAKSKRTTRYLRRIEAIRARLASYEKECPATAASATAPAQARP